MVHVLADRGVDVADSVTLLGANLDIPAFTRGYEKLPPAEATQKLAKVRIHVQRYCVPMFSDPFCHWSVTEGTDVTEVQ